MPTPPRVFLSYSHDSDAHRERILALSERLRRDGITTILDRYVNGTPPEGWPRWMLDRLDESNRVLLICTPTYYRRFRGHEAPGQGRGVDWEGAIITQEIYDARSRTTRFIPVLFDSTDEPSIPEPLRGHTHYCPTSEGAYQNLYDALLQQAGAEPGPVGDLEPKPRPRGKPLTFDPATTAATPRIDLAHSPPAPSTSSAAVRSWRRWTRPGASPAPPWWSSSPPAARARRRWSSAGLIAYEPRVGAVPPGSMAGHSTARARGRTGRQHSARRPPDYANPCPINPSRYMLK